jgi:hypothetical protein
MPPILKNREENRKENQEKNQDVDDTQALPSELKPSLAGRKNISWQRFRRGVAAHPRLLQLAVLLLLMGSTSAVLLYFLFRGAWPNHPDNAAILGSILKMELSREDSRAIHDDNTQRVVTRTFSTLERYVEADGWTWMNRFGSTITYGQQDQRLIASCSPYSPLYVICDLSEIP